MISSPSALHAERALLAKELAGLFDHVTRVPEEARAGTKSDDYLSQARECDFLVVLLTQDSRSAVLDEIKVAMDRGAHIAAFALQYPPHFSPNLAWDPTVEEKYILDHKLFVRNVGSVVELIQQLHLAVGQLLARTVNRFRHHTTPENYALANEWLSESPIERVALVQNTSILALGSRIGRPKELECLELLQAVWRQARARTRHAPKFLHVFDARSTERDWAAHLQKKIYRDDNCQQLLAKHANTPRVGIAAVTKARVGTVILVNHRVALGTPLGNGEGVVTVVEGKRITDDVWGRIQDNIGADSLSPFLKNLAKYLAS